MEVTITRKLSKVREFLKQNPGPVACDVETTALSVNKGHILCVGIGPINSDKVLVWWPKNGDVTGLKLPKAVFHNAQFDLKWLKANGAEVACVWDTMLMAHLLDENRGIGLKELGMRLLGYDDWALDEVKDLEPLSKTPQGRTSITRYLAMDVQVTRELMAWQRKKIKTNKVPGARPYSVMKNITLPAIEPLMQMENNRMPLFVDQVNSVRKKVEAELADVEQQLDMLIPPESEWPDYLKGKLPKWGSTNWTRWWLFEHQGAKVSARGKPSPHWPEGSPSVSATALLKIDHPGARLLEARSMLHKRVTGFLIPLAERGSSGRVSTSFKLTGTVTGRLSSASPSKDDPGINSQQIPRDPAIRSLFGEAGHAWIEVDYSQLELRVAAVLAQEKTMIKLFANNEDIHTYIAKQLVGSDDITSDHRTLAKGVNFGFLYGMQSKHFASYLHESYGQVITQKEAEIFRREYFATFNGLDPWYRKQRSFAIKYGGVTNAFGRFRHLPKVYDPDYWVQESSFRQAINSPVQSTGSDFMLISIARLAGDLRLQRLGAKLITTVHDSVCLTAPMKNAVKVGRIVKDIMERADDTLKQEFYIKADVTISKSWGGKPLKEF